MINYFRRMILWLLPIAMLGCSSFMPTTPSPISLDTITDVAAVEKVVALENLTILSGIGGFCLLSGIVLLTISRGSMGWRPIIGGIILIVLNYAISVYASWIFLPIIGATGIISLAWGYRCVIDIIKIKIEKEKENGILK